MKFSHLEGIESFALVGATGLVGQELLDLLCEHKIKFSKIKLLASQNSVGERVDFAGEDLIIEELSANSFDGVEVAFFCVPNEVTEKFVPIAISKGCLVIDDSSVFRQKSDVALIVPEVNGEILKDFSGKIISIPNCTTTPLVMALKPLAEQYGIERVVVSTYQSVSGAGRKAFEELSNQTTAMLSGKEAESSAFPHRIAFNCLPEIGQITESGNTSEEEKVVNETRKILDLPDLKISSTAVRVPTFIGHGLSVNVELQRDFSSIEEVRELWESFPGIKVIDNAAHHIYPTNVECSGSDFTFIGRARRDGSVNFGLNFWVITDNLRKGAALNALQCLDTLNKYRRMS
ncbi:MAG: aspartate-semialdehyde dehydrogenase [Bdellovibrionales bacterium]|nr:aspartate-semialdehyde dehydrogenase [Bdellovibrionales bacterium]